MQPNRRAARSKRSAESRARLLIKARLGWIEGYPLRREGETVLYQVLPRGEDRPPEVVRIDGRALSRASRTVNELRREFPRALPRIVGDVERWVGAIKALIAALKPAIHRDAELPALGSGSAGSP